MATTSVLMVTIILLLGGIQSIICYTDYDNFYMLHDGSDVPDCGHNAAEACATFGYLLDVFHNYNKELRNRLTFLDSASNLNIVTDLPIIISKTIMVSYPWLSGLNLVISNFYNSIYTPSFTIDTVTLNNIYHTVHNMIMQIRHCTLIDYRLSFKGSNTFNTDFNTNKDFKLITSPPTLKITNSVLNASLSKISLLFYRTIAYLSHVVITGANQTVPILLATDNSSITLRNCDIYNNMVSGDHCGMITVNMSWFQICNCSLGNNQGYSGAVIHATLRSLLFINESSFDKNQAKLGGGVMYLADNVTVHIAYCSFTNNKAGNGSVIFAYRALVRIVQATFTQNNATLYSGCLKLNKSDTTIINSSFVNNFSFTKGAALFMSFLHIKIVGSNFTTNQVLLNTGVLFLEKETTMHLNNCMFISNTAGQAEGIITALNNINMFIKGCTFDNNTALLNPILWAAHNVSIIVTNSTFTGHAARGHGLLELGKSSTLTFHSCSFHNNKKGSITVQDMATLYLFDCIVKDTALAGDTLFFIVNSSLTLNNTTFTNNRQTVRGGIVQVRYGSTVNITSCTFLNNSATEGGLFYAQNSTLIVQNSTLINNFAQSGSVAYLEYSTASFNNCFMSNCTSQGFGGAITAFHSYVEFNNTTIYSSRAGYGGCIYLNSHFSLSAYNFTCTNSNAIVGGAIYQYGLGNTSLENSNLISNRATLGGAIFLSSATFVRLAGGSCVLPSDNTVDCIFMENRHPNTHLYTLKYSLLISNRPVCNSQTDNFYECAKCNGMIHDRPTYTTWRETSFASLLPVPCGKKCHCYYNQNKANVYNCSNQHLKTFPQHIQDFNITDWIDLSNNSLNRICDTRYYLSVISKLILSQNKITYICAEFFRNLKRIETLDLRNNNIHKLPSEIRGIQTLTEIQLAGNPFICDCHMFWMKKWMAKIASGRRVVIDYENVKCPNGLSVDELDEVKLGCFPKLSPFQQAVIGISAFIVAATVLLVIFLNRRWEEVKWFMYLHFNILNKKDASEDTENIMSDALLSYSDLDADIIQSIFLKYDEVKYILEEDHGFKLLVPDRDFLPGTNQLNCMSDAVQNSRRMIMVLTRNYVNCNWCKNAFELAHHKMVNIDKKYVIPILLEPLDVDALPRELQMYLRTSTYIDATKIPIDLARLRKQIRFLMPGTPLSELRTCDNEDVLYMNYVGVIKGDEPQTPRDVFELTPLLNRDSSR